MKKFSDFLKFKLFITPKIMPVMFWVFVFVAIVQGITTIVWGARIRSASTITSGVFTLLIGPVVARMLCEWFMSFFRE